jgi:hypothetical protein
MILLANISSGTDFIGELLAKKSSNPEDDFSDLESKNIEEIEEEEFWEQNGNIKQRRKWKKMDERLRETGFKRMVKLFNLISCRNSYIAEQVAMVMANVSCSGETEF